MVHGVELVVHRSVERACRDEDVPLLQIVQTKFRALNAVVVLKLHQVPVDQLDLLLSGQGGSKPSQALAVLRAEQVEDFPT
ncbi:hypothetical protein AKJ55_02000 [candidate division MSBL1 archaeon SCGC-AAA382M17]|uniref:Uncharacterized protein n=1 Tax=candidate division MSBL1 archaeon SCGC-AAA382M17 TaxID=1698284 RepID=A0ABR5TIZ9_9EURY|nr:hypothetical protein AKJ55_02000 [candidate division MSBL1 archaeon SCGC-AAA382M17]